MPSPSEFYTNKGSEFHYGDFEEVQEWVKKLNTEVIENGEYAAYNVYYNAISEHGLNNNAAAQADKQGFNWTCDYTNMWHQAREDLGL